jgi:hypothetical protein
MLLFCQFFNTLIFFHLRVACAHCFDFAFKLDQDKDTTIQKYVAMIRVVILQSAMIFGFYFGYVGFNHDQETSKKCSVLHGALCHSC